MKSTLIASLLCCVIVLPSLHTSAQKIHQWSAHIGFGAGLDGDGLGLSFDYAYKPYRILNLEAQVSIDNIRGTYFLSANKSNYFVYGLGVGARLNILPNNKKWNPSIYAMPGFGIYNNPIEPEANLIFATGFSNTFYQHHGLSVGTKLGHYLFMIKYGYIF